MLVMIQIIVQLTTKLLSSKQWRTINVCWKIDGKLKIWKETKQAGADLRQAQVQLGFIVKIRGKVGL